MPPSEQRLGGQTQKTLVGCTAHTPLSWDTDRRHPQPPGQAPREARPRWAGMGAGGAETMPARLGQYRTSFWSSAGQKQNQLGYRGQKVTVAYAMGILRVRV